MEDKAMDFEWEEYVNTPEQQKAADNKIRAEEEAAKEASRKAFYCKAQERRLERITMTALRIATVAIVALILAVYCGAERIWWLFIPFSCIALVGGVVFGYGAGLCHEIKRNARR